MTRAGCAPSTTHAARRRQHQGRRTRSSRHHPRTSAHNSRGRHVTPSKNRRKMMMITDHTHVCVVTKTIFTSNSKKKKRLEDKTLQGPPQPMHDERLLYRTLILRRKIEPSSQDEITEDENTPPMIITLRLDIRIRHQEHREDDHHHIPPREYQRKRIRHPPDIVRVVPRRKRHHRRDLQQT